MQRFAVGVVLIGMAAALSACVAPDGSSAFSMARVDPDEAAERALIGSIAGTAAGVGIGTALSINPAIGAVVGAEAGATIGAAAGIMTAQPIPAYTDVPVSMVPAVPDFYDTWPPGAHPPAIGTRLPPPRPG